MKSKVFTIVILSIISFFSFATADKAIPQNNIVENKVALTNIFKVISQKPFMICKYQQIKTIERLNRDLKSNGLMVFSKDQGIAWKAVKPFISTLVLGTKGITQIDASGKKTTMMSSENEVFANFAETIQSVFKGDFQDIVSKYDIIFSTKDNFNWTINLTPKDNTLKSIVPSIVLMGNEKITAFIINEGNGDKITYNFSEHSFPSKLKPEEGKLFD